MSLYFYISDEKVGKEHKEKCRRLFSRDILDADCLRKIFFLLNFFQK